MNSLGELSARQELFVSEYLVDCNGAYAARRAGYSTKTAKEQAFRLLTKGHIKSRIQAKREETEVRLELTRDDVIRGLTAAFHKAKREHDPMAMIAAMREIAKMMGYYPATRGCGRTLDRTSSESSQAGSIPTEHMSDRDLTALL